jgi:type 1 fimbriae regulatory protein FimB
MGKARGSTSGPLAQHRRTREHLAPDEVERMIIAAGHGGRLSERDALLIMMAYRHGLRASELIVLRRDQIDLKDREPFTSPD